MYNVIIITIYSPLISFHDEMLAGKFCKHNGSPIQEKWVGLNQDCQKFL